MSCRRAWLALVLLYVPICTCLDNGLGRKPPLGFNTWNYFGCSIDEEVVLTAADQLVLLGLADAGYTHVNLDDCWHTMTRAADNSLQADPAKFPSGMRALADSIHAKGLQFGIYSDAGLFTCAGYPGSRYFEREDAALFASWGVDYLKYDNCYALDSDVRERYQAMRDALNSTGRPIYFSMCDWGVDAPWQWGPSMGNSWRTDADIAPTWDSVLRALDNGAAGLARFAGPGGWNDPDMLEVGIGSLSLAQQRSHFALWALVKAPLLIGADLEHISQDSLAILKAKEVIAIDQDELGVAGDIIFKEGPLEVWAGPLSNDERAVILFNRHIAGPPTLIHVTWSQLGYSSSKTQGSGFAATVRDLYAEQDLGVYEDGFEAWVQPHDCAALRVTPVQQWDRVLSTSQQQEGGPVGNLGRSAGVLSSICGCAADGPAIGVSARGSVACQLLQQLLQLLPRRRLGLTPCRFGGSGSEQQQRHQAEQQQQLLEPGSDQQQQQQRQQQQQTQQQQVTWRPWHDPASAQVQQAKRAAAVELKRSAAAGGGKMPPDQGMLRRVRRPQP